MYKNSNNVIYEIILQLIKNPFHVREIAKQTINPVSTVQNNLIKLIENNVVDFKLIGKNKTYNLKNNIAAKKYVYNAENYKLLKIIHKHPFLAEIFEEIIKISKEKMVILFGSYAKEIPKQTSDIDIYVETDSRKIKKEIEYINTKINVKIGRFDKDSLLIKEIIKNHVIIYGTERYYEELEFFK